jgi:hypothetical protein
LLLLLVVVVVVVVVMVVVVIMVLVLFAFLSVVESKYKGKSPKIVNCELERTKIQIKIVRLFLQ